MIKFNYTLIKQSDNFELTKIKMQGGWSLSLSCKLTKEVDLKNLKRTNKKKREKKTIVLN